MNYNQIMEAKELAVALPIDLTADDECAAFIIQYVPDEGTGGAAATAALVQGATDEFTVTVDAAAPAGADAFGTAGVLSTAGVTQDTVGEFCNIVNGYRAWRAICLCKPETPMANVLAKTAASCLTNNGLAFYLDTSVADTTYIWSAPITGEAFDNYGKAGHKKEVDDKCVNSFHMAQVLQNFTSAANLYLYVFKPGDATSTLVFTKALTDNTLTDVGNVAQPNLEFYTAPEGYTLIVDIRSDATTSPTTLSVVGKTVVRKNNRRVTRYPHVAA